MSFLRLLPFAFIALPLLLAAACQPADRPQLSPALDNLHGTWLHSFEEDRGDTLVYRPNTYAFPPSRRGRTGFALGVGGRFTQYDIAPTDGLQGQSGTWTLLGSSQLHIQLDDAPATESYELEVLKLRGQKLSVRRVVPAAVVK